MAVAGFPLRRKKAGVRGRERLSHLHDAPESQGSERKEGLRQGAAARNRGKNTTLIAAAIGLQGAMGESVAMGRGRPTPRPSRGLRGALPGPLSS